MSSRPTTPSRLSRTAAKEVPHRKADRFYAAKASLRARIEQLTHDVQHSTLRDAARTDLLAAAERAEQRLREVTEDTAGGRNLLVELERHVGHLQEAERWVCLGERVLARMGSGSPDAAAAV